MRTVLRLIIRSTAIVAATALLGCSAKSTGDAAPPGSTGQTTTGATGGTTTTTTASTGTDGTMGSGTTGTTMVTTPDDTTTVATGTTTSPTGGGTLFDLGDSATSGAATGGGITPSDKVDLLFVVDNSVSMADKQAILASAVPDLLERLANPVCRSSDGSTTAQPATPDEACPDNLKRQFKPVEDLHVGVISSSLGAGSSDFACLETIDGAAVEQMNDRAHLIPTVRAGAALTSYDSLGFLAWDPGQTSTPPGSADLAGITAEFQAMIAAVGDNGCGLEAPLEAMYRFLMDPQPYASVTRVPCSATSTTTACRQVEGVDTDLLNQRAAFLRPDSVLAVMLLTDENDCSVWVENQGFLTGELFQSGTQQGGGMFRASAACDANPNDVCCYPCVLEPPTDCANPDPTCAENPRLTTEEDHVNIRCHEQRRRFGVSFLTDVQRYVIGLSHHEVPIPAGDGTYQWLPNPIYAPDADGNVVRAPGQVFFVGIVGIPWQDVATAETRDEVGRLDLLNADQLVEQGVWDLVLGDPATNVAPSDPFVRESVDPRSGSHPITADAIIAPGGAEVNTINLHERDLGVDRDDLQYSCIFELPEPKDCSAAVASMEDCECAPDNTELQNPLCRNPADGTYGTTQYYAKAYPPSRILQVLKGIYDYGLENPNRGSAKPVVASICPKNAVDESTPDFGYRPVIGTLIGDVSEVLLK